MLFSCCYVFLSGCQTVVKQTDTYFYSTTENNRRPQPQKNMKFNVNVDNNMKLNVRTDNGKYQISGEYEDSLQPNGWSVTIPSLELLKDLREKIDQVIASEEKPKDEIIWNPRSQRHEIKRGK